MSNKSVSFITIIDVYCCILLVRALYSPRPLFAAPLKKQRPWLIPSAVDCCWLRWLLQRALPVPAAEWWKFLAVNFSERTSPQSSRVLGLPRHVRLCSLATRSKAYTSGAMSQRQRRLYPEGSGWRTFGCFRPRPPRPWDARPLSASGEARIRLVMTDL